MGGPTSSTAGFAVQVQLAGSDSLGVVVVVVINAEALGGIPFTF
jgi:hypothetical protein